MIISILLHKTSSLFSCEKGSIGMHEGLQLAKHNIADNRLDRLPGVTSFYK